jgi:hypothetical protein
MAKPIFLIGFPTGADRAAVYETQKALSRRLEQDYHVLTYQAAEVTSIKFEVLNAINATDIEIEQLIDRSQGWIDQLLKEKSLLLEETKNKNNNI